MNYTGIRKYLGIHKAVFIENIPGSFYIDLFYTLWEYLKENPQYITLQTLTDMYNKNILNDYEYLVLAHFKNYNPACQYAVDISLKNDPRCNHCPFRGQSGKLDKCNLDQIKHYNDLVKEYNKYKDHVGELLNSEIDIVTLKKYKTIVKEIHKTVDRILKLKLRKGVRLVRSERSPFSKHEISLGV